MTRPGLLLLVAYLSLFLIGSAISFVPGHEWKWYAFLSAIGCGIAVVENMWKWRLLGYIRGFISLTIMITGILSRPSTTYRLQDIEPPAKDREEPIRRAYDERQ